MRIKRSIAILPFIFLVTQVKSQEFTFRHLSVEDGLSQSAVFDVVQDDIGYIWIGTADGLNRYDGYEFIHFRNRPTDTNSISDNFINCIEPAGNGALWVGTVGGGLNYYDPSEGIFTKFLSTGYDDGTISHNDIYSILETDAALFVGTYEGLGVSRDRKTFTHLMREDSFVYTVNDILLTQSGDLLITHDFGISFLNESFDGFVEAPSDLSKLEGGGVFAYSLFQFESGEIWIGTDRGVWIFNEDYTLKDTLSFEESGFAPNLITAITADQSGNIWLGSNSTGLAVKVKGASDFKFLRQDPYDGNGLTADIVNSIFQDRSGVVWIGTHDGGINIYDRYVNQFRLYRHKVNKEQSISGRRVFALYEDENKDIWVGTDGEGLNLIDNEYNEQGELVDATYNRFDQWFQDEKIWAIEPGDNGELWIGTVGSGLKRFHPEKGVIETIDNSEQADSTRSLSDNSIFSLYNDHQGFLWIGTDFGLNRLDLNTKEVAVFHINFDEQRQFSSNSVMAIEEDVKGQIWVGTFGGGIAVFSRDGELRTRYRHNVADTSSISYDKIMSIYRDSESRMWVGTFGGGFNLFDDVNNNFTAYTELQGLPNDVVYGFLEDDNGYLWMSTNKGLSAFNKETGNFRNFDVSCNLQSDEFNQGAYCKGKSGLFYFGGINGFNSFHPGQLSINTYLPEVAITAYHQPGKIIRSSTSEGDPIQLSYSQNSIFFDFVGFNYVNSHLNKYRYKLDGLNQDWVEAGDIRTASFTNLDPGSYTFKVQAANNDGLWNLDGGQVSVFVESPIYMHWWFTPALFGLITLILSIIAYLAVKTARSKAKQQLVETELKLSKTEKQSVQYRLSSLRAQMDPHFIFNSLNSIQHFIANSDKSSARSYLSKFASLMRLILNSSREEVISVTEELDTLKLYIDLERLRFDYRFSYEIKTSDSIDLDEVEIPTMLLQPYIENAIIHGLKNKPGSDGKLLIEVKDMGESRLRISIEDNGIGRKKAKEIRDQKLGTYKSLGMEVTQDRLSLWGTEDERPEIKIEDLFNDNGDPIGTRVEITIITTIFD